MTHPWIVLKFGGTSVASRERWETIMARARAAVAAGERPLIVCSAAAGVTDRLEALPRASLDGTADAALEALEAQHRALADALGVSFEPAADLIASLRRVCQGAALLGEVSGKTRARILSTGELLSTRLGVAFLAAQGVDAGWVDARQHLRALPDPDAPGRTWLSAVCDDAPDAELRGALGARPEPVLVTQGFIAGNEDGETVLLGRGGSDTSAAYFAAKLGAARCEIWTDVPGMFTADPRLVPEARLLRRLDYDEAQEIASTGAKVLHPRAIAPARRADIPLEIRCTPRPELEGTTIRSSPSGRAPQVKALSTKRGVVLVSMSTLGMWQQVGFLSSAFDVFRRRGLSIDLVSTSETNVTVTLDPTANALDPDVLEALVNDLRPFCAAEVLRDLASVSLVGIGIRSILHRLGPALEQFEEQPIHLVSQAASDLNLTFVVDPDRAERLVRKIHAELFSAATPGEVFGRSWRQLAAPAEAAPVPTRARWWRTHREELLALAGEGTPAYAYHAPTVRAAAERLAALTSVERAFYAVKANAHPGVLAEVHEAGLGFECVSLAEVEHVRELFPKLEDGRLLFTPNFAPRLEYEGGFAAGAQVTVDNLHPLERWPEVFSGRDIFVRVDTGVGRGHHKHVKTAGARQKFGVDPEDWPRLRAAVDACGARVVGLHAHSGSGIRTPDAWIEVATRLAELAETLPDVRVLDVGGGLGVPERPGQSPLDLGAVDASLAKVRAAHPEYALWMEPGRYVVAESGVLLARVHQVKTKQSVSWVGVDAGMHTLIRPALYGAWHEIVNLSRLDAKADTTCQIVGPICETGDVLGRSRRLPATDEGDVLLIAVAGAYGRVMASTYNLRALPREVMVGA